MIHAYYKLVQCAQVQSVANFLSSHWRHNFGGSSLGSTGNAHSELIGVQ